MYQNNTWFKFREGIGGGIKGWGGDDLRIGEMEVGKTEYWRNKMLREWNIGGIACWRCGIFGSVECWADKYSH